jgi:hypothetical protein
VENFDVDMARVAGAAVTAALRELLEKKHLYQSVTVSRESLDQYKAKMMAEAILQASRSIGPSRGPSAAPKATEKACDASIRKVLDAEWVPPPARAAAITFPESIPSGPMLGVTVSFRLPTVHTFCSSCDAQSKSFARVFKVGCGVFVFPANREMPSLRFSLSMSVLQRRTDHFRRAS